MQKGIRLKSVARPGLLGAALSIAAGLFWSTCSSSPTAPTVTLPAPALVAPPNDSITSTPTMRQLMIAPGAMPRVLATITSQGSPSPERVWGMKP